MAAQRNILHDCPTPWRVDQGKILKSMPVILDARDNLVCTIAINVGVDVAQRICDAINGPSQLDDLQQYQERQTGQIYFGARWKELHDQALSWEFEPVRIDGENGKGTEDA